jgi:glucose/mannose transport system permease protein
MLNPEFGVQQRRAQLGWESFTFDPLYNPDIVIYGILIAGLWQGTGLVMCLMLAGLRGIDEDIWKAARVDGIPMWKTYLFIVIPMMRPVFVTTLVIIASGIVGSTTSWSRRPAAGRASRRRCRRCMSTTTCSPRRTSARALPPRP